MSLMMTDLVNMGKSKKSIGQLSLMIADLVDKGKERRKYRRCMLKPMVTRMRQSLFKLPIKKVKRGPTWSC